MTRPVDRAHHPGQMSRSPRSRLFLAALVLCAIAPAGCGAMQLMADGDARELRDEPEGDTPTGAPTLLIVALDGVGRDLLYDMIARGELPELVELLGGADASGLGHAHLDDTVLSVLPSSTLAAWSSVFTGVAPAVHGVAGNEYFVREERRLAAPAPVSVHSTEPVVATYADGYVNALLAAPTIYERLRERDPELSAWVSMSQIHHGADRLLLTDGSVVGDVFGAFVEGVFENDDDLNLYSQLDRNAVENVVQELAGSAAPRVLTVYLPGADLYGHGAVSGPDVAVRRYLREIVDPLIAELRTSLAAHHALANRYVMLLSDHGHTAVLHDEEHALSTGDGPDDPPAIVRSAGFHLRPFELEVGDDVDFDAVLAYGGAMAYVYVADRSTCPAVEAPSTDRSPGPRRARAVPTTIAEPLESAPVRRCDWSRPARYEGDVLPMAEAFYRASAEGLHAPGMRGTLDLVLVRSP
nr:alkaline phosphatase family protein [Myxococcota bacterium]